MLHIYPSSTGVFKKVHYIPARSRLRENSTIQSPKWLYEAWECTLEEVLKETLEAQGLTLELPSQSRVGPGLLDFCLSPLHPAKVRSSHHDQATEAMARSSKASAKFPLLCCKTRLGNFNWGPLARIDDGFNGQQLSTLRPPHNYAKVTASLFGGKKSPLSLDHDASCGHILKWREAKI